MWRFYCMKGERVDTIKQLLDSLMRDSAPGKPAWNIEIVLGHMEPVWNYVDGCMIKGVLDMHAVTGERRYLDFADSFVDWYVAPDGAMRGHVLEDYNNDQINEGKVLFPLYRLTGKEKYRKAIDILYRQIQGQPRTKAGNFWHKNIYPYQIWLDGLYMTLPFYARYEAEFDGGAKYPDILRQFANVNTLMRDPATGLVYHGYDETRTQPWADKATGCSPHFWSRSLGWYAMALVDTLEIMDGAGAGADAAGMRAAFANLAAALDRVADPETGMFWQVADEGGREGNYLETSGSCAVAYAYMKGARLGLVPARYFEKGKRTLESVVRRNLVVDGGAFTLKDICLVAGLGYYPGRGWYKERDGSYEYYISEPRVDNDAKGVAPLLFAYSELLREGK